MAVRDPKTEWIRVQGYRAMTPQRRFEIARGLTREGRWIALNMARKQRNGSPREIELDFWNRIYGRAIATRVRALIETHRWKMEAEQMDDNAVVHRVVEILTQLQLPYALVGAYSSNFWGRPRTTQDADLIVQVSLSKATALFSALNPEFVVSQEAIEDAITRRGEFNAIHSEQVFKVDFWISGSAFDKEVFKRRHREELAAGLTAYVQSPEDTILSKLRWCKLSNFSERQFSDALGVYEVQEPTLDQAYLDKWARELQIEDLLARVRADAARPVE